MRKILLLLLLAASQSSLVHAQNGHLQIPISRQGFHDNIDKEQAAAAKFDGKADDLVKVSDDQTINLQVTNALLKEVDDMQIEIERDSALDHRLKVKYLTGLYTVVKDYNQKRSRRKIEPEEAPSMISAYRNMMRADIKGKSIEPYIKNLSFDASERIIEIFHDNPGYKEARGEVFSKYAFNNLETVMPKLQGYLDYPGTDSIVAAVARKYPNQVLTYATSYTPMANLIKKNQDPVVQLIVRIGQSPQSTKILPFIDQLMDGSITVEKLETVVDNDYQYYKQMVKSMVALQKMKSEGRNPFGMKAMMENMLAKSLLYIREVNDLHEESAAVRFRIVKDFTPEELYYLIINGQEELYTSSYTNHNNAGLYDQMMIRMKPPRGDSLLMMINFDRFKKFIAMAAGFNTLDHFLKSMAPENSNYLMQKYVQNLEKTEDLEDAVDVANSFGSIRDEKLLNFLRAEVKKNLAYVKKHNDRRGTVIYQLLTSLFENESAKGENDSSKATDIAAELSLPPINFVGFNTLQSDSGRVYQQVFFYGDKDGQDSYASFMGNFPSSDWKAVKNKYWVTITSLKGKPTTIYANLPIDEPGDKEAIQRLSEYLDENDIHPTIFIHRGHSYHINTTLDNLQSSAKIVVLGSCGGYHNLATVLEKSPEAHIISSKQVGTRFVNEPIIHSLEDVVRAGKNVDWVVMWAQLGKRFAPDARNRELFSDYVPPHKNLGAIFIKAYRQIMKDEKK
ncbi:hypothetical protein HF324_22720 [Chitinophaga oryzae]|uniref:Uncharacterized protein n=1 Tax=Chitinophaga oryzae TaxID=2725414 RepID=A0AAE6ZIT4_9BACT|nr:hypothetical protein [Chitinophaga oryzae]QJB33969.1 hypothetical protein HF329_22820 [Chitinophaga oryzae]QJB40498.1 hypothetical protein HF324_22720 [Chitinophaga oryzae]